MPSSATITAFYSFTADTRARASQVNVNFGNFRGHFVPIEVLTITSSDNTYDLGSDEHRWRNVYTNGVDLETSTTTATLLLKGDVNSTLGAFLFTIEGTEYGRIGASTTVWDNATTTSTHVFKVKGSTKVVIDNTGLDGTYLAALSVNTNQISNNAVTPGKRSTALYAQSEINTSTTMTSSQTINATIVGTGRPILINISLYSAEGGDPAITFANTGTLWVYKAGSQLKRIRGLTGGGVIPIDSWQWIDTAGNVGSVTYDIRMDASSANVGADDSLVLSVIEL